MIRDERVDGQFINAVNMFIVTDTGKILVDQGVMKNTVKLDVNSINSMDW